MRKKGLSIKKFFKLVLETEATSAEIVVQRLKSDLRK